MTEDAETLQRGNGLLCHRAFGRPNVSSHLYWGLVEQHGLVLGLSVKQKGFLQTGKEVALPVEDHYFKQRSKPSFHSHPIIL